MVRGSPRGRSESPAGSTPILGNSDSKRLRNLGLLGQGSLFQNCSSRPYFLAPDILFPAGLCSPRKKREGMTEQGGVQGQGSSQGLPLAIPSRGQEVPLLHPLL